MTDRDDMSDIKGGVAKMLRRLGMGDVQVLMELQEDWDEIAGRPWAGRSRPMGIQRGELLVESTDPGMVSMLRYAEAALREALAERFGQNLVTAVKVVPPPPGGPR